MTMAILERERRDLAQMRWERKPSSRHMNHGFGCVGVRGRWFITSYFATPPPPCFLFYDFVEHFTWLPGMN